MTSSYEPKQKPLATNLAHKLNVFTLDILHDHDLHLREEVKRQVVDGISAINTNNFVTSVRLKRIINSKDSFYRRMDFWMRSTLQPAFLICLTMLRMYWRSSRSTRSI